MAADRLSALPDRVLQRVVSHLPVGDAARTSLLSRRLRTIWLQADGVNLDSRSYYGGDYDGGKVGRQLFHAALAALGAAGRRPVRSLSVFADSSFQNDFLEDIMRVSPGMDAVLAAPATRRLEELHMELSAEFCQTCDEYVLPASLLLLPCQPSLRVLDLDGLTLGPPCAAADFGRLETLKLASCKTSLEGLQAMLDAAPRLARLCLKGVSFTAEGLDWEARTKRRLLLRCPDATVSVAVIHCHGTSGLDIDAPSARSLRYKGYLEHFPFGPASPSGPPVNLQHVEVSVCTECSNNRRYRREAQQAPPHALFWGSIGRFRRLRVLKLELLDINDIAVLRSEEEDGVFLKPFPELVFLELKGSYEVDSHAAAVAIANLLHCSPALQVFHLKCKLHGDLRAVPKRLHLTDERKARLGLEKSMESLERHKSEKIASPSSGVEDGDGRGDDDLAALKARSFPCLESHLKKIRLEFELKSFDCFEVRLAKFLVENALVLEEMEVHDGSQRVSDHIHRKLPIWRANSLKSKIKIVGEYK
ncbi:unnamed protein product [Urochloa decumbens]|uniref:F-box domain-containing protein n=1 Tax=Urochloa decumbens TaxID=240449 RepID=A0ABC9DYL4_9POAL